MSKFLIISAAGEARITTRRPTLRRDEVAFRLNIDVPKGWGRVIGDLNVQLPEPPEVSTTHDPSLVHVPEEPDAAG